MTLKTIPYVRFQRRYGGKFIARKDGRVLASGDTYAEILKTIRKRGLNRQVLVVGYVPPKAICIYDRRGLPSLSSYALRAKDRPLSLRVIDREMQAYRRSRVVSRTAGLLGGRFPSGVTYERRLRQRWAQRVRRAVRSSP
jgi:hypothetical protein